MELGNNIVMYFPLKGNENECSKSKVEAKVFGNLKVEEGVDGIPGGSLEFNTFGDRIEVRGEHIEFHESCLKEMTISWWAYFTGETKRINYPHIFTLYSGGGSCICRTHVLGPAYGGSRGKVSLFWNNHMKEKSNSTISGRNDLVPNNFIKDNEWNHYCTTYSNSDGTAKFYINGKLVQEISISRGESGMLIGSPKDIVIGGYQLGKENQRRDHQFKGRLSELIIFNKSLTEDEVQQIFEDRAEKLIYQPLQTEEIEEIRDIIDEYGDVNIPFQNQTLKFFKSMLFNLNKKENEKKEEEEGEEEGDDEKRMKLFQNESLEIDEVMLYLFLRGDVLHIDDELFPELRMSILDYYDFFSRLGSKHGVDGVTNFLEQKCSGYRYSYDQLHDLFIRTIKRYESKESQNLFLVPNENVPRMKVGKKKKKKKKEVVVGPKKKKKKKKKEEIAMKIEFKCKVSEILLTGLKQVFDSKPSDQKKAKKSNIIPILQSDLEITTVNSDHSYDTDKKNRDIFHDLYTKHSRRGRGDLEIVSSDGVSFPCHKVVIFLKSNFFRRMMGFKGLEYESMRQKGKIQLTDIDHLSSGEIKVLLRYYYTGTIENKEEGRTGIDVLIKCLLFADKYLEPKFFSSLLSQIGKTCHDDCCGEVQHLDRLENEIRSIGHLIKPNEKLMGMLKICLQTHSNQCVDKKLVDEWIKDSEISYRFKMMKDENERLRKEMEEMKQRLSVLESIVLKKE